MKYLNMLCAVYYWGLIEFQELGFDTDLLLFRERSMLLLPDIHEENRFVILSSADDVKFMIGSSSEGQFEILCSFFQRLYPCYVVRCDPPPGFMEGRILLNSRRNRKKEDFYYPSFIRNIINIPSMIPGVSLQYHVVIRSSGRLFRKKRFSFALLLGLTGDAESLRAVENVLRDEVVRLRKRFGWKFRIRKRSSRLRSYSMADAFSLSSFTRVTLDEGIVQG